MQLNYERLKKHPLTLLRLSGLKEKEFEKLHTQLAKSYQAIEAKKYVQEAPVICLPWADKLLCVLVYYRGCITHTRS